MFMRSLLTSPYYPQSKPEAAYSLPDHLNLDRCRAFLAPFLTGATETEGEDEQGWVYR